MKRSEIESRLENTRNILVENIRSAPLWASAIFLLIGVFIGLNLKVTVMLICVAAIVLGIACIWGEADDEQYDRAKHAFSPENGNGSKQAAAS